ncbi:hypothetical protein CDD81_5197 [Ophiocordyceps australis]|uniref:Uncharacterized protein n=1 Tax=Ophiocordyceps australis TaxID=1399860 RepID=A0A2C5XIL6_9HYPO|nr:hypothetical protein CDD81_5197 [Ophiocordyceps australis]
MKSSIILTLAGLGAAFRGAKIPWYAPSSASGRCGGPMGYLDHVCGTKAYCDAFDRAYDHTDGFFTTKAACYAAHKRQWEPVAQVKPAALLPWIAQGSHMAQCGAGPWPITDARCGTQRYCEAHDTVSIVRTDMPVGTRKERLAEAAKTRPFVSAAQCFAAHEPNPSPSRRLEPWVDVTERQHQLCGLYHYRESECGTARYCAAFDHEPELIDGRFANSVRCLRAHKKPPSGANLASRKLAWQWPGTSVHSCAENHFYDIFVCGTRIYCDAFDLDRTHANGRFKSSAQCYEAFEEEPLAVYSLSATKLSRMATKGGGEYQ